MKIKILMILALPILFISSMGAISVSNPGCSCDARTHSTQPTNILK